MKQVFAWFLFCFWATGAWAQTSPSTQLYEYKFDQVLDRINDYYVDSADVNMLVEKAIIEMLKNLDPHSVYIKKEEIRDINNSLEGSFEGIGVNFNLLNDTVFIISPLKGGPAELAGVRAGDKILFINTTNVAGVGITIKDVKDLLSGIRGSKVDITVVRHGKRDPITVTILRDKLPYESIESAYMLDGQIGYLKLSRFAATSVDEFRKAWTDLYIKGAQKLIIDLQGNGGGYLRTATRLADQFLDNKKMIVFTEGDKSPRRDYLSTSWGDFEEGQLVILIDEGSASASEILAGAIQDWDRGVIVGRRSFGKGLVQHTYDLVDSSAMRLTIARYYTPTGRSIQKDYKQGVDSYRDEIEHRINSGELYDISSLHFPDSLRYQTLIKNRPVFGGGGIVPDVFVPLDTLLYTSFYTELMSRSIMSNYTLQYYDRNLETLQNKYGKFQIFDANFVVDDVIINDIEKYVQQELGKQKQTDSTYLAFNKQSFDASRQIMRVHVKASLAQHLWGINEYYRIMNTVNPSLQKAIELLSDDLYYQSRLEPED